MKIIFMGTPDIARKSLQRLYDEGHDILAIFTGNDKPRNRGMKLSPSPVKELALERGTPVHHPADLDVDTVKSLGCELIAVVAFGKILRQEILDIPPFGCINIHGSLLPKYRGAAPIQHAILNGEAETGVTSMYMSAGMDEGDMIFTEKTPILPEDTSADLFERLGNMGAQILAKTIDAIGQGRAPRVAQNHAEATYAPMLTKEMAPIDWTSSARAIDCKVRALIPWPVATMEHNNKVLKVYSASATDNQTGALPGTIISKTKSGIKVACGSGTVVITKIQAPGGKVMHAADYLRGLR